MAKRIPHKGKGELDIKSIAILIGIIAAAVIIYQYLIPVLLGLGIVLVLGLVILVVGAYFVLPRLGITGLAALLSLGKK